MGEAASETTPPPSLPSERRTDPLSRVERKVDLIKELWGVVQSFRSPSSESPGERYRLEAQQLNTVREAAVNAFPEAAEKTQQYRQIDSQLKIELNKSRMNHGKISQLQSQIDALEQEDDVMFLLAFENGVQNILGKRSRLREAEFLADILQERDKIPPGLGNVDNFHILIEGFQPPNKIRLKLPDLVKNLGDKAKRFKRLKELGVPEQIIKNEGRRVIGALQDLENRAYEELLAEIYSQDGELDQKRASSFDTEGRWIRVMEGVQSAMGVDADVDNIIIGEMKKGGLDLTLLRKRMREFYDKVRQGAPEKVKDLSAAFVLFPPAKWDHIDRLVKNWTSKL